MATVLVLARFCLTGDSSSGWLAQELPPSSPKLSYNCAAVWGSSYTNLLLSLSLHSCQSCSRSLMVFPASSCSLPFIFHSISFSKSLVHLIPSWCPFPELSHRSTSWYKLLVFGKYAEIITNRTMELGWLLLCSRYSWRDKMTASNIQTFNLKQSDKVREPS